MLKGEIWWADLPPARGSEPAKTHPVLIVQCDTMNRSSVHTVICAAVASNLALEHAPGNFRLEKIAVHPQNAHGNHQRSGA